MPKEIRVHLYTYQELDDQAKGFARARLVDSTASALQKAVDREGEIDDPHYHLNAMLDALSGGLFLDDGELVPEECRIFLSRAGMLVEKPRT